MQRGKRIYPIGLILAEARLTDISVKSYFVTFNKLLLPRDPPEFRGMFNTCSKQLMLQFEHHWPVAVARGRGFVPHGVTAPQSEPIHYALNGYIPARHILVFSAVLQYSLIYCIPVRVFVVYRILLSFYFVVWVVY